MWTPHLLIEQRVGSKNAAEPPGRSHLYCPSADCPPGGARVHCSAGHAPSCSEPETMSLTQRQCHKYGTVCLVWLFFFHAHKLGRESTRWQVQPMKHANNQMQVAALIKTILSKHLSPFTFSLHWSKIGLYLLQMYIVHPSIPATYCDRRND